MNGFDYQKDGENIVTISMDLPGQPVNTINKAFMDGLEATLQRLERDEVAGVILTSGKDSFLAGGDLKEISAISADTLPAFAATLQRLKSCLRHLETLGKPVVAAINGTALGGGYELCLACHHRIALRDDKSRIGLPEVSLGLLPGGGGIVRLVRRLGLEKALPLLMEGTRLSPERALEAGLVEELAADRETLLSKARTWIRDNPSPRQPWDEKGCRIPGGTPAHPKVAQMLMAAPAMLRKKTRGLLPAPEAILAAASEGAQVDFAAAQRIESSYFLQLVLTPEAKNQISFFFQLNGITSGSSRPEGFAKTSVNRLGILGAGMMGAGIAYVAAKVGIEVVLLDRTRAQAEKGKAYSAQVLDRQLAKGRITREQKDALLERIQPTTEMSDFTGCDLLIEAVFEDQELKGKLTGEAEKNLAEGAFVASNTSTLPITELAQAVRQPENFIGLHFFSPVDKMPLVEIICGQKTSPQTLAKAFDFVQQLRKTPIVVNDSLGFFTSRVFSTFLDEGAALLEEGVDPLLIDNLARLAGMPVGPLTVMDEVSQQLLVKVRKANRKLLQDRGEVLEENATDRVLAVLTGSHGREGKAYNGGFYDYPQEGRKTIWAELYTLFRKPEVEISRRDIQDRILFRQVLEAVRCLEEGVLRSVADGNVGSIFGIGFPAHTGGQLQFINSCGLQRFVARARQLEQLYGERFAPPALLLEKAANHELFT
ncbi:3-hydroxyacyl-CoA dehydrogenase [Geothermobacter hydrogeniphilus]|uniref:3-hydroxyacyl-CoA dehydrogenase n=1 Tax=Geothermobacter hydrogeniphilus TaxID=1969733 RepID=A0A2K2HB10_9BACT|nr:3-hydroxyacyl-CoA dehydrogenase NAD-binding domain-containing protein [Geothermobacter hydrogeniphilus]PNU20494.1 3-hydroxyacyl-CoA dehydrogenase [Geothermobacter hydrogeniphilus]